MLRWALRRMPDGMRIAARDSLQIGKDTVAPLVVKAVKGVTEEGVVIHHENPEWGSDYGSRPKEYPSGLLSRAGPF